MPIEVYEDDAATLAEALPIPDLVAAAETAPIGLWIYADKDAPGGPTRRNARFFVQVEDRVAAEAFVSKGWPPVDERWARVRIDDFDNAADPTWSPALTDYNPCGAYAGLFLGDIPAACGVHVLVKFRVPSDAAELDWTFGASIAADAYSEPLPPALAVVSSGILTGVGDPARSGLVRGFDVTVSGPADDEVHVAAGVAELAGKIRGFVAVDLTLDQNDVAAAALAPTESYRFVVTVGASGPHATKGAKAVSPTNPTAPAGEPFLRYGEVHYNATGSEIEASDLEGSAVFDRYFVEAGSGTQLRVHAGHAIGGGAYRFAASPQLVSLGPSSTFYLYQLESGLFDAVEAPDVPPVSTALGAWAEADTDAVAVTALRRRPTWANRYVVLRLEAIPTGTPGALSDLLLVEPRLALESVTLRASDNGGGSAGETRVDVKINGASIYPGSGTDDQRPAIAFDAAGADLIHDDGIPDGEREWRAGDVLSWETVDEPTGGSPARLELHLFCWVL